MDFALSDEQQAFVESARAFSEGVLAPGAAHWDAESIFPKEALAAAGELGFMGMYTPEEAGGLALSRLDASLIVEELARGCTTTTAFAPARLRKEPTISSVISSITRALER